LGSFVKGGASAQKQGVDDDRQVGQLPHQRDRVQVQGEPGRGLEGPDPPLAEHHAAIALGEDVLGGQQPLLDGG